MQEAPSPTGYGASAVRLPQSEEAFFWMADLRLAAWFLWMTPLEAALSSCLPASTARVLASSALPASAASRNLRTAVFSADFTDLLRSCAASFCRLRLIWDLMFATSGSPRSVWFNRFGGVRRWSRHEGKRYQRLRG